VNKIPGGEDTQSRATANTEKWNADFYGCDNALLVARVSRPGLRTKN